ncbi:MAG: hypothetical protein EBX52_02070 [Proteobacteria bacterium]|nr:hypothetical protein [Pseudomonadota bacterium]
MILMRLVDKWLETSCFLVTLLTSAGSLAARVEIPPCPEGTERHFDPPGTHPAWASCKDRNGLYQGLLIQFSGQSEVIRVAAVRNSLRHGKEIRFGHPGTLEERTFQNGHLEGPSFIHASEVPFGRVFPKNATTEDWAKFALTSGESILKPWIRTEPLSTIEFKAGRLSRMLSGKKDYHFSTGNDGRIMALDHPEMKGGFFIDPEPLWDLAASDLKTALTAGFGSCKKYAGPLIRYGRHYDVILFKRLPSEKKQQERLEEIRERFIRFCVPKDLLDGLGKLECGPQLPGTLPPHLCLIPISDQSRIPYDPKYFKYENSLGYPPGDIRTMLEKIGLIPFLSDASKTEEIFSITKSVQIRLKKSPDGLKYRVLKKDAKGRILVNKDDPEGEKDWYEWKRVPGL